MKVYEPLIRHRWALCARDPSAALAKLQVLPAPTLQAILEHLCADAPVVRTNLPVFKLYKIVESIPFESAYVRDLTALLRDASTSDFALLPRDADDGVRVHRFILACAPHSSGGFQTGLDVGEFRDPSMGRSARAMFAEDVDTGQLDPIDAPAVVDLFGTGAAYEMRDVGEIDFLAKAAIAEGVDAQNAAAVRQGGRAGNSGGHRHCGPAALILRNKIICEPLICRPRRHIRGHIRSLTSGRYSCRGCAAITMLGRRAGRLELGE
jgi:hypothetical protein